ncbi:MAG: hypothetical protein KGP28_08810 [Bdellovibrionales bacterium]|nr:hypothetical protein [Bdellovibrionales bacterium]
MRWIIGLFLFFCSTSFGAQLGKIIVDSANVLEFPKAESKTVSTLKKNSVLQVSNLPTEGFYKVRLPSGDLGWVSGNDMFVSRVEEPALTPDKKGEQETSSKKEEARENPDEFWGDRTRIQIGFGLKYTVYGGLSDYFVGLDDMNFGQSFSVEIQRRWFYLLYWALRVELNQAQSGDQQISAATVQRINEFSLPIQFGILFHPIHTRKLRIGLGAYAGASVVNYTQVEQEVSSVSNSVKYSSIDPVGSGVIQVTYGLSKAIGIFGEFDYRYHVTGEQSATTVLGSVPGFQIDYSSYFMKAGLELRF